MKKRWIVSSILVGLLTAGLAGGAVLAQATDSDSKNTDADGRSSPMSDVIARVAEILGVEQDEVEDAFDQAITEQAEQKASDGLAKLVEMGVLTQEQSDAYQTWLDARPDGAFPVTRGFEAMRPGFHGKGFRGFGGEIDEKAAGLLAKLVELGKLTQEEADAYQSWLDDMPEIDFSSSSFRGYGSWGDGFRDKGSHGIGDKN